MPDITPSASDKELCIPYELLVAALQEHGAIQSPGENSTLDHDDLESRVWVAVAQDGRARQVRIPVLTAAIPVPILACGEYAHHLGISRTAFISALTKCVDKQAAELDRAGSAKPVAAPQRKT